LGRTDLLAIRGQPNAAVGVNPSAEGGTKAGLTPFLRHQRSADTIPDIDVAHGI
jgi:hypothetical protein